LKATEHFRTAGKAAGEIREEEQCDDDLAIFRGKKEKVRENRCHTVNHRLPCGHSAPPEKKSVTQMSAEARRSCYGKSHSEEWDFAGGSGEIREEEQCDDDLAIFRGE